MWRDGNEEKGEMVRSWVCPTAKVRERARNNVERRRKGLWAPHLQFVYGNLFSFLLWNTNSWLSLMRQYLVTMKTHNMLVSMLLSDSCMPGLPFLILVSLFLLSCLIKSHEQMVRLLYGTSTV